MSSSQSNKGFAPMEVHEPSSSSTKGRTKCGWTCFWAAMATVVVIVMLIGAAVAFSMKAEAESWSTNEPGHASVPKGSLRFYVIGDWGRSHHRTTRLMDQHATTEKPNFVISTGDNIYENGVSSVNDAQFNAKWKTFLVGNMADIPWFLVLGNHDYHTNSSAEVLYSLKEPRWMMPAKYYRIVFFLDGRKPQLHFSNASSAETLKSFTLPNAGSRLRRRNLGDVRDPMECLSITFADTTPLERSNKFNEHVAKEQLEWLDKELEAASACMASIVVGHHTIYSSGIHGSTNMDLKPLLLKHDVDAYICGHDHHAEYIYDPEDDIDYLVSGAGSALRDVQNPIETSVWSIADSAFLDLFAMPNGTLQYTFYTDSGETFQFQKPGKGLTP